MTKEQCAQSEQTKESWLWNCCARELYGVQRKVILVPGKASYGGSALKAKINRRPREGADVASHRYDAAR